MSKDAYYFPHDSNARHDPKIVAMTAVYGMAGYGYYWAIIEILREQKDYLYPLDTKYAYNSLAREALTSIETIDMFIRDCVQEFELLEIGDGGLYSESLNNRMASLDRRRKQAQAAANSRWSKVPKKEPKPKKVDPSKVKTMSVLTNDDYWVLFLQSLKDSDEFGMMKIKSMEGERKKCIDWLRSKGKSQKDYRAFFKNWLRRKMEQEGSSRTNNGMVF